VHKLTVKVTPEIGATVRVAGEVLKGDSVTLPREPGWASVAVAAPGYMPFRKLVELVGDETTVVVQLRPLPSKRHHVKPWILLAMVVLALVKMVLACR